MMDFYNFFGQKDVQEAMRAKIKDVQEKKFIEKEYETEIDGKRVKFALPNDVRKQLYLLELSNQWMSANGQLLIGGEKTVDEIVQINISYLEGVTKNMLIDGAEVNDLNELSVDDLKAYGFVYYLELLLPLSHRSATKSENSVRQILKGYLNK